MKPLLCIRVNNGERSRALFQECEGDGSRNVFLPLTADFRLQNSEFRDLKVGDVVFVIHPDTPRGRWPLGRIVESYPGRDGHTRVAKVACGVKTVVRRINKLIPLGINF